MRPRLLVVWGLLVVLVGAIVLHEGTGLFDPEPPAPTGRIPMFAFTEPELGGVEVIYQGRQGALMRDPGGQWFLHDSSHSHSGAGTPGAQPAAGETHLADPGRAAAITERLVVAARMLADRRVRPEGGLGDYGLANPETMIAFYGRTPDGADYSRPLEVLYVGDFLPGDYTYYAMRDGDQELSLIPRYFVAQLLATIYGEDQAPSLTPERQGTESDASAPVESGPARRF